MAFLTSQMSFFGFPFIYLFYSACLICSCVHLQKVNIFQSQTTTLNNLQLVSLRAIIKICILRRVDEVLKGLSCGCFTIIKKFMMDLQNPFHWITKCRFYPKCWEGKKYFHLFQDCMIYWILVLNIFIFSMNGSIWGHQYLFAHILLENTIFPLFWRDGRFILKNGRSLLQSCKKQNIQTVNLLTNF